MKKASHAGRKKSAALDSMARAVRIVRRKCRQQPRLGIILGSGFHRALDAVQAKTEVPYSGLPGFPKPSVEGHRGRLVCGTLGGVEVAVLAGRAHYYEGQDMEVVTFGMRVLARLGVETVVVTNAAGGINPRFRVGDFMMLTDHINFMGMNPLRGGQATGGSRFVDLTQAYDLKLRVLLRRAARQIDLSLRQGVYLAMSGPSYETPAEIRAFRRLGADAVGMSTVPEVIVARQEGLRVAGLSCITNLAAGLGGAPLDHDRVLQSGARVSQRAAQLLEQFARLYAQA